MTDFTQLQVPELLNVFNDQLKDFMEQLDGIVIALTNANVVNKRSKSNLDFYRNLLNKTMSLSSELAIEGFGSFILKDNEFVDKIVAKDEDYFVSYNFSGETDDNNLIELIGIVKDIIRYLNAENKEVIFDYLNILCQLTVAYAQKKYASN